jgi:hypothetical protein
MGLFFLQLESVFTYIGAIWGAMGAPVRNFSWNKVISVASDYFHGVRHETGVPGDITQLLLRA